MDDRHDAQLRPQAQGTMTAAPAWRPKWRQLALGFAILWAAVAVVSAPAFAHEQHRLERQRQEMLRQQQQQQQQSTNVLQAAPAGQAGGNTMAPSPGMGMQGMHDMMVQTEDRSKMTFFERTLLWLGAFHPMIIHFPIAFFPAALFTAIVGRRRPAFSAPVQFLVVAGGIIAPIAALLGWFNAGFALVDGDRLLLVHRWLGTAMGVGGLLLAIWAWRRPWEDRGGGMILSLSLMTIAIAVQGWFGGALVYGMEHLNW
ncbi:MAG: hypothetical protein M3428_04965 [Pseudomonadota bacterium]|nr:hypothetical protein [Pseudomonadota bacterium]